MTGWGAKWQDSQAYKNMDSQGIMHFPTVSPDAARYLASRNIRGFGIDTLSPDLNDANFPTHTVFLASNTLILENMRYVPNLATTRGFLQVIPLAIQGGTESPIRLFFYQQVAAVGIISHATLEES